MSKSRVSTLKNSESNEAALPSLVRLNWRLGCAGFTNDNEKSFKSFGGANRDRSYCILGFVEVLCFRIDVLGCIGFEIAAIAMAGEGKEIEIE